MFNKLRAYYMARKHRGGGFMSDCNSSDYDRCYRRIIIINRETEKILIDKMEVGPLKQEYHLRQVFADSTNKLKGLRGDVLVVKCNEVVQFKTLKK